MSLFIHSADFNTGGNSSDGVWEFNSNLKGDWHVIGQHMDTQDFPWMWVGQDTMCFRIHNPDDNSVHVTFTVTFDPSLGYISDLNTVASTIQSAIQDQIDFEAAQIGQSWAARTMTVTADLVNNLLNFSVGTDFIDVMWDYKDPDAIPSVILSTINPSFELAVDYPRQLAVSSFSVSSTNIVVDPKYLECYINESNTQYATASGARPNLYFSTRDGDFTGQTLTIPDDTNTLTIQIRRLHSQIAQPLTNTWFLILSQAGN